MNRGINTIVDGCIDCKYFYRKKLLFMKEGYNSSNLGRRAIRVEEKPFCKLHRLYIGWKLNTGCGEWRLRHKSLPILTLFSIEVGAGYTIIDMECPNCGIAPTIVYEWGGCVRENFICVNCEESLVYTEIDKLVQETEKYREYYILEENKFKFGKKEKQINEEKNNENENRK